MNQEADKYYVVFATRCLISVPTVSIVTPHGLKNEELGEIRRVNWIITDWYRTQSYYDSGSWRATWEGRRRRCTVKISVLIIWI